jgi:hypothetical protein
MYILLYYVFTSYIQTEKSKKFLYENFRLFAGDLKNYHERYKP